MICHFRLRFTMLCTVRLILPKVLQCLHCAAILPNILQRFALLGFA